jgi:hypothetical protein
MSSLDALTLAMQIDRVCECERRLHRELEALRALLVRIAPAVAEGTLHEVKPEQEGVD